MFAFVCFNISISIILNILQNWFLMAMGFYFIRSVIQPNQCIRLPIPFYFIWMCVNCTTVKAIFPVHTLQARIRGSTAEPRKSPDLLPTSLTVLQANFSPLQGKKSKNKKKEKTNKHIWNSKALAQTGLVFICCVFWLYPPSALAS